MIARFWDALFDYADEAKRNKDRTRYEICHEIQNLLQEAYDKGIERRSAIKDYKPGIRREKLPAIERIVISIPDIEIYRDKNDAKYYFELDGRHFDYPEEVLFYLIDYRSNEAIKQIADFRATFLKAVQDSIEDLSPSKALKGKQRTVKEVKNE